jgi:predicted flap endonuclease-1-like 5' DNA nuclease
MNLDTPIQFIKGVGPVKAKLFNKLGVFTLEDLLEYFPRDWEFVDEESYMQNFNDILKHKVRR